MVASYRNASFACGHTPLLATARAGNVIGGGDWSEDRLIPDLVRAVSKCDMLEIRNPTSTRPWQHVLESLSAYLSLGQGLLDGHQKCEGAWNFGPSAEDNRTVTDVLTRMRAFWPELAWRMAEHPQPHEAQLLYLDSGKARDELGWRPIWSLDTALRATADWYRHYLETGRTASRTQLEQYVVDARANGATWTSG
jgi:CDP-glucose 4,6-dehydratase